MKSSRFSKAVNIVSCCLMLSGSLACDDDRGGGTPGRVEGTEAGDCEDGSDNDGDGFFDCADDSCSGSPRCGGSDAGRDAGGSRDANDEGGVSPGLTISFNNLPGLGSGYVYEAWLIVAEQPVSVGTFMTSTQPLRDWRRL